MKTIDSPESRPTVRYIRLMCPGCESLSNRTTHTRKRYGTVVVRLHACNDCGLVFESRETVGD